MSGAHDMSDALRGACERLRALLLGPTDTRARHAIGALVREVKGDPGVYGGGAVTQLAVETGQDVATLYRHASVAACWSLDEVEQLLAAPAPRPLSWSHLVLVASVDDPEERSRWIARCRAESLSIRGLEELLATRDGLKAQWSVDATERLLREAEALSETRTFAMPPQLRERAMAVYQRLQRHAEQQLRRLRDPQRAGRVAPRLPSGSATR